MATETDTDPIAITTSSLGPAFSTYKSGSPISMVLHSHSEGISMSESMSGTIVSHSDCILMVQTTAASSYLPNESSSEEPEIATFTFTINGSADTTSTTTKSASKGSSVTAIPSAAPSSGDSAVHVGSMGVLAGALGVAVLLWYASRMG